MEDEIITELIDTKLWRLSPKIIRNSNLFHIYSSMVGYSDGRYRLEITKLKRKIEGKSYKISIFWTPYNPDYLVFNGRFDSFDELKNIINTVNPNLLDINRIIKKYENNRS